MVMLICIQTLLAVVSLKSESFQKSKELLINLESGSSLTGI